jgi:hypothetical protein
VLPAAVVDLHNPDRIPEGERFWDNVDLCRLDVSMNSLVELPEDIDRLDKLQVSRQLRVAARTGSIQAGGRNSPRATTTSLGSH